MNKLKLMYDDSPIDVMERVNTALEAQGIVFELSDSDVEGVASYALFVKGVRTDVSADECDEDEDE